MACKSFGMALASPNSQEEYSKLQNLLSNLEVPTSVAIAVFRSAVDSNLWLDGNGNTKNYLIDWIDDNSWDATTDENCAVFLPLDNSPMTDVSCKNPYAFVCESLGFDVDSSPYLSYDSQTVKSLLNEPLSITSVKKDKKIDVRFSKPSIKLSFFEAKLLCQSLQMDLYTPDPSFEDSDEIFDAYAVGSRFLTSITSMGKPNLWYSAIDGSALNSLRWSDDSSDDKCAVVVKGLFGSIYYDDVDCSDKFNFICQKVSDKEPFRYDVYSDDDGDDDEDDDEDDGSDAGARGINVVELVS
jgi:hypothetical protein